MDFANTYIYIYYIYIYYIYIYYIYIIYILYIYIFEHVSNAESGFDALPQSVGESA